MNFSWSIFVDLGIICCALLAATLIRAKVRFFQRYLIPNALTAGFLLLPFYNYLAPRLGLGRVGLENLVFHLLNLAFVAMSLRGGQVRGAGKRIFANSVTVVIQYTLQATLGLGLTLLFIYTFAPGLFPSFGFLLPLGYALGPGQAFAIGKGWEDSMGFVGGGSLGLIFAAIGYIWACFGGVYLINLGRRHGWIDSGKAEAVEARRVRTGVVGPKERKPVGSLLTTETEAIDTMSYNLGVLLGVYLLSYLFLRLATWLLSFAGTMGEQLATNLWGIAFIFAALIAMLVRRLFVLLKIDHTLDNGSLTRIAGISVDIMVTAAIAAITIVVLTRFWIPILILAVVGGVLTTLSVIWTASRLFTDHRFDRVILFYGCNTGTLSTGLALLRVIDPEFETPVATDYMYGSGLTFVLVIPMILMLNLPGYWSATGDATYLWVTLGILAAYAVFCAFAYCLLAGKRRFRGGLAVWLKD